ncbi:DUF1778 domain-containing protein [Rhodospirillum rubrum]|nr:DUF1778 domain-containing protein [Rhodospirillum rubrum]
MARFLALLDKPPAPTPALREAARRYFLHPSLPRIPPDGRGYPSDDDRRA